MIQVNLAMFDKTCTWPLRLTELVVCDAYLDLARSSTHSAQMIDSGYLELV